MGRRAALLTQTDYVRAIRAAQQCGASAVDFKPDGTIRVHIAEPPERAARGALNLDEPDDGLPPVVL
jgi:hypothetical protein